MTNLFEYTERATDKNDLILCHRIFWRAENSMPKKNVLRLEQWQLLIMEE